MYELSLIVWNFPLFRRIYRPLPKLYGNVLQVGCGTGILNTYLKKRGDSCSIDNLDINEKYLMYGKKLKRYDNYIAENIETFKSKKKYNIILFSRSFHHIRKVKKALGNCSNLLSDEGRIIIFDIARANNKYFDSMVYSYFDGLIRYIDASNYVNSINKLLPYELEVSSFQVIRQRHFSNYNPFFKNTDVLLEIKKSNLTLLQNKETKDSRR